MADPAWREDPVVPLNAIQGYMRLDDSENPENKYQQAIKRREELLANARQTLSGEPEKFENFNALYAQAEPFATITEDHNFYIDQRGNTVMRLPILEMGLRLVKNGTIAETNDVFHLTFDGPGRVFRHESRGSGKGTESRDGQMVQDCAASGDR